MDFSVDSDWERPDVGDTSIIDNHGPSRPSNLYVVAVSGSALTLSWSASVDNVGVEGYKIFRDGIEIGLVTDIFYTDATVIEGNTYQYTVQAYDATNNFSEISEPLSVAIEEREEIPSAPINLRVDSRYESEITLSWDIEDELGIEGYKVYRDGVEIGSTKELCYQDRNLESGKEYNYYVRAYTSKGSLSDPSNTLSISTIDAVASSTPTNLSARTVSGPAIYLNWDKSHDNVGVAGYKVYRNDIEIATLSETYYMDSLIYKGARYTYKVIAFDEANNLSESSNKVVIEIQPDIPSNLTITVREDGILIRWTAVNEQSDYELNINGDLIKVGNETSYMHLEFLPNHKYDYKIRAISEGLIGPWSEVASILTAPGKVENLRISIVEDENENMVKLTWDPVEGAQSYDVEIDGVIYENVRETFYYNQQLDDEKLYNYRVRAVNGELIGVWSEPTQKSITVIYPGGDILEDTVWEGKYIVTGDVNVVSGAALQIKPGTIIRFHEGTGISVDGELIANGTDRGKIVF